MDGTLVYSKTPRGIAEISLRSAQLSMTARRVLIMIDGKRTIDDLSLLGKQNDIENAIASLEDGGLIQRVAYQSAIDVPTINGRDTDAGFFERARWAKHQRRTRRARPEPDDVGGSEAPCRPRPARPARSGSRYVGYAHRKLPHDRRVSISRT